MGRVRSAGAVAIALTLAACAGGQSLLDEKPVAAAAAPSLVMAGRWILAAPDAPSCGVNFTMAQGKTDEGGVAPEGGCPGKFFTSRHWLLTGTGLTIDDYDNNPLAVFTFANGRFESKSADGVPVSLAR
jgi:hypothetical protein